MNCGAGRSEQHRQRPPVRGPFGLPGGPAQVGFRNPTELSRRDIEDMNPGAQLASIKVVSRDDDFDRGQCRQRVPLDRPDGFCAKQVVNDQGL